MLVLEIAAQGVKGVTPAGGSARLRPGYNVVPFDGAAFRRLLGALLHPADEEAGRSAGAAPTRAALTVVGDDGATYRLFRDFGAGWQLHRLDPQRRAFALVSDDARDIARRLEHEIGAPSPGRLALLGMGAADLPSRQGLSPAAAAPQRRALGATGGAQRLADLRAELDRARRVEKLQFQVDGLQQRIFRADETLKEGARLAEAVAAADGEVAALAKVAAAAERLGDAGPKLAGHARALARRDEALAKLAKERDAIASEEAAGPPAPFWRARRFWAGAGAGVAAAAAGAAGAALGGVRYLALLDIPAFGWAAYVALGWVSSLEARERSGRRHKLLDDVERKVLDAFERETADVRGALAAVGVAGVAELSEALGKLAAARAAAAAARERLGVFEARPEIRAAVDDRARAAADLAEAEAQLAAEAGGFVRDPRSVLAEITRVEAELATPPDAAAAEPPQAAPHDPFRRLGELAAQEFGGSAPGALRSVQAKASQAVQALSANRMSAIAIGDGGEVSTAIAGRPVPVSALPPADRDLAFVALKLALLDRTFSAGGQLALLDDGLGVLPEAARRGAARTLKALARSGQLLHATSDPAFREAADHAP